jgi:hypothetical protein
MAKQERDVFHEAIAEVALRFFQQVNAATDRIPNPPGRPKDNQAWRVTSMEQIRRLTGGQ